jgi:hypothetical protein
MYFGEFPSILYQFNIKGKNVLKVVRDITLNVRPLEDILNNIELYNDYDIEDGDTPEVISEKIYGTPFYHWIIMLVNEKYDYTEDYPLSNDKLSTFVTQKYGSGNEYAIHSLYGRPHYEYLGKVVDSNIPGAAAISNFDYEFRLNEAKRRIRVVAPVYINKFSNDLTEAFNNG